LPTGTAELLAIVTVSTTRPAPVIDAIAAACVRPTTLGTATGAGPVLTEIFTADPVATFVPATGLSAITLPEGMVELLAVVTLPMTRPAIAIALVATACVAPTTFGTSTFAAPLDTTKLTAEPDATLVPGAGLSEITIPEAIVALDCVVTVLTARPAPVIALIAAACVAPTTFGTDTFAEPLETIKLTAEPEVTLVPATGLSEITSPEATVVFDCVVTAPRLSPTPVIAVAAAVCVDPTTFGTTTGVELVPLLTVRLTAEPAPTCVAAAGLWLMTLPTGTLALLVTVTVPSTRPTPVSAVVAAA
jgi:hypothetical protein